MREESWFSISGSAGGADSEPAIDFNLASREITVSRTLPFFFKFIYQIKNAMINRILLGMIGFRFVQAQTVLCKRFYP